MVWLGLVGAGLAVAVREETTPGAMGEVPAHWPAASRLPAARPGASRIVMFLHPQCPCSRASLHELGEIVADVGGRADVTVVFARPDGTDDDWLDTDRWRAARATAGVSVISDGGGEHARFGAKTSGHTVVYDPAGRLVFAGGITASRGHQGDNVGRAQVIARVRGAADATSHAVFGCGFGAP